VTNRPTYGGSVLPDSEQRETHALTATEFDELAVGHWLHVEQMEAGRWWASIGGVTMRIEVDRDGRPRSVEVIGPEIPSGLMTECDYRISWDQATATSVSDPPAAR
jgi:hypothetical protein